MKNFLILFFASLVVNAGAAISNLYWPLCLTIPDSSITVKASDSSQVYEIGKTCDTCTIFVKGEDNLILKEFHFAKGEDVKHIFFEYNKKQELNSMLIFKNGKLIEKRNDYGKDDYEYRSTYKCTLYYDNGKIKEIGPIKKTYKNGVWNEYYSNGKIQTSTTFDLNIKTGKYSEYYENGKIKVSGGYTKNARLGYWTEYDTSGTFVKGHTYDLLSMYDLSKADLQGCVVLKELSNSAFKMRIISGDHIAVEYAGGEPITDGVLRAIRNDSVFIANVNVMGADKELFGIPVISINSVGYLTQVGGLNAMGYRQKRKYEMIKVDDKKYTIDFYDENCL